MDRSLCKQLLENFFFYFDQRSHLLLVINFTKLTESVEGHIKLYKVTLLLPSLVLYKPLKPI